MQERFSLDLCVCACVCMIVSVYKAHTMQCFPQNVIIFVAVGRGGAKRCKKQNSDPKNQGSDIQVAQIRTVKFSSPEINK